MLPIVKNSCTSLPLAQLAGPGCGFQPYAVAYRLPPEAFGSLIFAVSFIVIIIISVSAHSIFFFWARLCSWQSIGN
jgi:hypothetical protein